jgi:hypothetical protein
VGIVNNDENNAYEDQQDSETKSRVGPATILRETWTKGLPYLARVGVARIDVSCEESREHSSEDR